MDGTFRSTVSNAVLLADKVRNSKRNKHDQKSVDPQRKWETIPALDVDQVIPKYVVYSDLYTSDEGLLSSGST